MSWFVLGVSVLFTFCNADTSNDSTFDYIVVGAGTTGGVVAARLSEDPTVTVLLIEAGGEPLPIYEIPFIAYKTLNTEMDWQYTATPQKNCCSIFKDCPLNRGKTLGGSSSINFMTYTRGNRFDFDHWQDLGNDGWKYEDVLPYMLKLEDYRIPHTADLDAYHHTGGPVTISNPTFKTPLVDAFLEAGAEMGVPIVDFNGPTQTGFMYTPLMLKDGARCETNHAYIKPARQRPNFHLSINSLVTKILFNDEKVAVGVTYEKDSAIITATARREVIVCGGAINSPQLLMLSGIGPEKILTEFNLPRVSILPGVGQNFQDHLSSLGATYFLNQSVSTNHFILETKKNLDLWKKTRTGVMTLTGFEGIAFLDSAKCDTPGWSDIEIGMHTGNQIQPIIKFLKPIYKSLLMSVIRKNFFVIAPILLRPKSRGEVTLKSSDPHDPPNVNPNYLQHPDDIDILAEGLRICWKLGSNKAFQQYGAHDLTNGIYPQCIWYIRNPEKYSKCIVVSMSSPGFHLGGTCKMGPKSDHMAVVDDRLRVHGVKGLRVADASIMPTVVAGHTTATCLLIGEKVADMIKEDWTKSMANIADI